MIAAMILLPFIAGLLVLLTPDRLKGAKEGIVLIASFAGLAIASLLFKQNIMFTVPWFGFGIDLAFRLYHFSAFIILAIAGFAVAVSL